MRLLIAMLVFLSASIASAQQYKVGDKVVVIVNLAPLQIGNEIVDRLPAGETIVVTAINGEWLRLSRGKPGWIESGNVVPFDQAIDYFSKKIKNGRYSIKSRTFVGFLYSWRVIDAHKGGAIITSRPAHSWRPFQSPDSLAGPILKSGMFTPFPVLESEAHMFLEGTWIVQCPDGHQDQIGGITKDHTCETPGCGKKSVSDGGATVVCRKGHASGVGGVTRHHKCPTCGEECRRD